MKNDCMKFYQIVNISTLTLRVLIFLKRHADKKRGHLSVPSKKRCKNQSFLLESAAMEALQAAFIASLLPSWFIM